MSSLPEDRKLERALEETSSVAINSANRTIDQLESLEEIEIKSEQLGDSTKLLEVSSDADKRNRYFKIMLIIMLFWTVVIMAGLFLIGMVIYATLSLVI